MNIDRNGRENNHTMNIDRNGRERDTLWTSIGMEEKTATLWTSIGMEEKIATLWTSIGMEEKITTLWTPIGMEESLRPKLSTYLCQGPPECSNPKEKKSLLTLRKVTNYSTRWLRSLHRKKNNKIDKIRLFTGFLVVFVKTRRLEVAKVRPGVLPFYDVINKVRLYGKSYTYITRPLHKHWRLNQLDMWQMDIWLYCRWIYYYG